MADLIGIVVSLLMSMNACLLVEGARELPIFHVSHRWILQTQDATNTSEQEQAWPPPPAANTTSETSSDEEQYFMHTGAWLSLASRQKMYSEKMTKDVLLIYLGIDVKTALWQLEETHKKFTEIMNAFIDGSTTLEIEALTEPAILAHYYSMSPVWNPYDEAVQAIIRNGNATLEGTMAIINSEDSLHHGLMKFTEMLEAFDPPDAPSEGSAQEIALGISAIEHARLQRSRTQEMIVKYCLCVAGIQYEMSLEELRITVDDFHNVHYGLIHGSEELMLAPASDPEVIHWLAQVSALWEGRKGFHAIIDQDPSIYRLRDLVAYNMMMLGRYNVIAGLLLKTSSTPPAPMAPPPFPAFPPISSESDGLKGVVVILLITAAAVAVIFLGVVHVFWCNLVRCKNRVRAEEDVTKPKVVVES
mmetsp:Transcript_5118/g.9727  ORF Transcript_5118/g.9727 Transcript_5118/m.9727 type:complete len:417 (-) Transcript_5118:179-1429(-)